MQKNQMVLLSLLGVQDHVFSKKNHSEFKILIQAAVEALSVEEVAHLYVDAAYLRAFSHFLTEQNWLQNQEDHTGSRSFENFVDPYLNFEFASRYYLHARLRLSSLQDIKSCEKKTEVLENWLLSFALHTPLLAQKIFATEVLVLISELYDLEDKMAQSKEGRGQRLGLSLYRTYDGLDEIFNLNYEADSGMKVDMQSTERLYEGAGVGVQSGYSTLLTALRHLNPGQGTRLIDLGSGYGRFGFVIGLLRPDMDFRGYEYVPHRVQIANATVRKLQLEHNVHFFSENLASADFCIPDAEIYYLYDPFSEETYRSVLLQLLAVSRRQKIQIATKGNARASLVDFANANHWAAPIDFDNGNLSLFASI